VVVTCSKQALLSRPREPLTTYQHGGRNHNLFRTSSIFYFKLSGAAIVRNYIGKDRFKIESRLAEKFFEEMISQRKKEDEPNETRIRKRTNLDNAAQSARIHETYSAHLGAQQGGLARGGMAGKPFSSTL